MAGFHHMLFNYLEEVVSGPGQVAYTSAGTYSWIAPAGVTSVCVVCVGGGGGVQRSPRNAGEGGGLGWKNNIPVTPGQSYTVVVGTGGIDNATNSVPGPNGGTSYFISASTVAGIGGSGGGNSLTNSGGFVGDGGGRGGAKATGQRGAGGGAGGYSGNGGPGRQGGTSNVALSGIAAPPGGGGGGGGAFASGAGGGGVGIFGEGPSGGASGGTSTTNGGLGGSGGSNGGNSGTGSSGGAYGGGSGTYTPTNGGGGAVRIIWGTGRAFPATNTQNI